MQEIFSGVKVVEFGQYIAAPVAAKLMADLGAEVVKVELPRHGDMMRHYSHKKAGLSANYISENRGKYGVCLDLKRAEGAEVFRDLIRDCDVLIENFTPGVLARYGLAYDALKTVNPRLIMCSISGFGQYGPYAQKPGNDLIASGMSGFLSLVGNSQQSPVYPGANLSDNTAGIHALAAVACALFFRERTGQGQHIDLSLTECLGYFNSLGIVEFSLSRGEIRPKRAGAHSTAAAPFGIFKARDGYVTISVLLNQWTTFAGLMGRPELATDPRFDTNEHRLVNLPALIEVVEGWLQSFPNREQALALLEQAHILCGPLLETEEFINDPQTKIRGSIEKVPHVGIGPVEIPRAPFHFSAAPSRIARRAPLLGEHNEAVLSRIGYAADKIVALTRAQVLYKDPQVDELRAHGDLDPP